MAKSMLNAKMIVRRARSARTAAQKAAIKKWQAAGVAARAKKYAAAAGSKGHKLIPPGKVDIVRSRLLKAAMKYKSQMTSQTGPMRAKTERTLWKLQKKEDALAYRTGSRTIRWMKKMRDGTKYYKKLRIGG